MSTHFWLLIMVVTFLPGVKASIYNITRIDQGGIYFENIGKLNHFDSEWTMISYINMSDIHKKIDLIENTYQDTKNICNNHKFSNFSLCDTSFIVLDQIIPQLFNQENVLKELTGRNNRVRRVKRSYIDGIGTLFKVLFGTLDQQDAEKYDDAINNLDSHEHEILNLLKTQTNIIKSTITNFNNSLTDLTANEIIFNKNLDRLSNYTKRIDKIIFDIKLKQDVDEHLSLLTLITTELNNEISTIINAILFVKNNALHPLIITPEQYLNELRKTIPHLPTDTKYPLNLSIENVSDLLSLVDLVSYYMNDKLVFMIKTPLITQSDYNLFNIIPTPIRNANNTFIFILPKEKYFMIAQNKLHYTYLENLENCKVLSHNYICKLNSPLYSVYGNPTCETELMYGTNHIPKQCDTRIAYINNEQWHKMYNDNKWIFVVPNKTIATLSCKNKEPIDFNIIDTGILSITDNCKLFTSNIILQTEIKGLYSDYNSVLPPIDIKNDDCCKKIKNKNMSSIEFIPLKLHKKLDLENLDVISYKIDKIDEIISNLENDSIFSRVTNNFYFMFIIWSIIKAIVCYILYRLAKYIIQRKFFRNRQNRLLAIEDSKTCCARITNCITLKVNNNPHDIELDEIPSTNSNNETVTTPLRRSSRIAQLKIN